MKIGSILRVRCDSTTCKSTERALSKPARSCVNGVEKSSKGLTHKQTTLVFARKSVVLSGEMLTETGPHTAKTVEMMHLNATTTSVEDAGKTQTLKYIT